MRRGNLMTRWIATAVLAVATVVVSPCLAQHRNFHPVQGRQAAPNQNHQQLHPGGHAGDWLRRYKGLSPGEQEHALQSDPAFRRLSPEQPAVVAAAAAAFRESSTAATTTRAEPDGDVGTFDAGSETTGARIVRSDAAASTRPAAHGNDRGARSARHAARSSGSRSSIPTASEVCSRRRSATSCAEPPGCRSHLQRMADLRNRRHPSSKAVLQFSDSGFWNPFSGNRAKRFRLS